MKNNYEKIKPCPFCGGDTHLTKSIIEGAWEISCDNNKCKVVVCTYPEKEKKSVIAAWNRRAENDHPH